jgi:hypothetical protein
MSRSFVGKISEGYLSDVQSQHEHDSEISSDLVESTKILESQFKKKYQVLKSSYEQRLHLLSATLEDTCQQILTDEIIDSMKSESASFVFIPSLIQELVQTHLRSDREKFILELIENENRLKMEIQKRDLSIDSLNQNIQSISEGNKVAKGAQYQVDVLKDQLLQLENKYREMNVEAQEELSIARREKEASDSRERTMRQELDRALEELAVPTDTILFNN